MPELSVLSCGVTVKEVPCTSGTANNCMRFVCAPGNDKGDCHVNGDGAPR